MRGRAAAGRCGAPAGRSGAGSSGQSLPAHRRLCRLPEKGALPVPDRRGTRLVKGVICSPVHLAPRLITLLPAAEDNAKEQSTFLRLSERLGKVISPTMWPGQKDLPFVFLITSGKAKLDGDTMAAPWISRGRGIWLSEHPCPCLRSRPRGAAAAVVWCCRPGRAAGKTAGIPRGSGPPSGRVAVALTGEAERKKACQGLPGRGP